MTPETAGSDGSQGDAAKSAAPTQTMEEGGTAPEMSDSQQSAPQAEGRRTQLKIVREGIETLTTDVWGFKRSQMASVKRLEEQVATLRKELAAHSRSKDLTEHVKSSEAGSKRLEKQVSTLRAELASLKAGMAKEAARTRARDEATLSRILAKVGGSKPKAAKKAAKKVAKRSKKK